MLAREDGGAIRISVPATPAIVEAVRRGRNAMSVEFHAVREHRTAGGVREIERALVDAAPLTDDPEYVQTAAEIRNRRKVRVCLTEASEMDLRGESQNGRTQWKPNRVGPMPSEGTIASREAVERSLLAAGGVSVELVQPWNGSDAREGWRRLPVGDDLTRGGRGPCGASPARARRRDRLLEPERERLGRARAGVRAVDDGGR